MRFRWSILIALSLAAHAAPASALLLPESGTRIRITTRDSKYLPVTGPLVSVDGDTLTMHDGDLTGVLVKVDTQQITRYEVSRGRHGNSTIGGIVGLVIGAVIGVVSGADVANRPQDTYGSDAFVMTAFAPIALGCAGGVLGAVAGVGIGAAIRTERWRVMPVANLRSTGRP
jgi:hypothetical protein